MGKSSGTSTLGRHALNVFFTRLLFCFKGEPNGSTSIYEIGIDGRGLRQITNPVPLCGSYKGTFGGGIHDIAPAYLPDDRIVFLSTRPSG